MAHSRSRHRLLATALLAAASWACARDPAPGRRVLVVGVDGATLAVAGPLMEAGRMPRLRALKERGVCATLRSDPPMWSPALWTTIATGKRRERHGITNFTLEPPGGGEPVLANSRFRRTAALWNMASIGGLRVGVVGWWASWPPEPVNGVIVSDRTARERFADWTKEAPAGSSATVYPPEIERDTRALVFPPDEIDPAELRALADFTPEEIARIVGAPEAVLYDGFSVLKFAWQAQKSYARIGERLLSERRTDLTAVFLVAIDPVSHAFWQFREPEAFEGVDPLDARRLGGIVDNAYVAFDSLLGELLDAAGPDVSVIVCSDHGFRASGKLTKPYEAQSGEHALDGILVAAGPGIRNSATSGGLPAAFQPTLFDVAPTVLALLGLPAARDMEGRVLTEILDRDAIAGASEPIESWDRLWKRATPGAAAASPGDDAYLEQLRALGYLR